MVLFTCQRMIALIRNFKHQGKHYYCRHKTTLCHKHVVMHLLDVICYLFFSGSFVSGGSYQIAGWTFYQISSTTKDFPKLDQLLHKLQLIRQKANGHLLYYISTRTSLGIKHCLSFILSVVSHTLPEKCRRFYRYTIPKLGPLEIKLTLFVISYNLFPYILFQEYAYLLSLEPV